MELIQSEQQKNDYSLKGFGDNTKQTNICIIEVLKENEEKGAENLPNLGKGTDNPDPGRGLHQDKLPNVKDKERVLKAAKNPTC